MLARLVVLLAVFAPGIVRAGELRLEIDHRFAGHRLVTGEPLESKGRSLTVTRLDYLLTGFALKRSSDGQWMEADAQLVGFGSAAKGRLHLDLGSVPDVEYSAIRFHVGPDQRQNARDPNKVPAGHPLHPQVCGLHWGWQGGYIFMALEGRAGKEQGFSYHLATDAYRTTVELPLRWSPAKRSTLSLAFDVAPLFASALKPWEGQNSTHSRKGDPLPKALVEGLPGAFRVISLSPEFFREAQPGDQDPPSATAGSPYPLRVSSRLPQFKLPADNPITVEGVALGRRLFSDPLLSRDGSISCASCHQREMAFSDARRFSLGLGDAKGRRSSMPLFNLLWRDEFFWDGHARSLREQILEPIQDDREMGESLGRVVSKLLGADGYPQDFEAAFGERAITPDRIARAIEQFLLTLISQESKFDKAMRGEVEFTEAEKRGFQLFVSEKDPARGLHGADCFHCHGGSLFGGKGYFDNGLGLDADDPGRFEVTGKEPDRGKFLAPSLRNIARTAPYMHDGRFGSLAEVVDHYDSKLLRTPNLDPNIAKHPPAGLELSAEDKRALIAFLETLTDEDFVGSGERR